MINRNVGHKRDRGSKIDDAIERALYKVAIELPDDVISRSQLADIFIAIIAKKGKVPPTRDTLKKMISRARNYIPRVDEPWNIATLSEYEIPAEALPMVLRVWGRSFERRGKHLTIREAKWVSRLYRLVQDIDALKWWAKYYAVQEKITEITGKRPKNVLSRNLMDGFLWHELTGESELFGFIPFSEVPIGFSYEIPPSDSKERDAWQASLQQRVDNRAAILAIQNEEAERAEKEKIQKGAGESDILLGKAIEATRKEASSEG